MIQFTKIEATDAFSYKLLDFDFRTGLTAIEGVNGSSKSSIFMTLCQGLFNRNPKNCKVDEVNNYVTGQPYEIKIWCEVGEDEYVFLNSRKLGKIKITRNGRDISQQRIPENLALISEIIGADYNTFVDLVYQSKNSTLNLLETSTDRGRKDFVNRVLRLAEIDELLASTKEKEKALAGKNGKLAALTSQISVLESAYGELREVGTEVDLGEIEKSLQKSNTEAEKLAEEVTLLERDLQDIKSCLNLWFAEQQIREQLEKLAAGFDEDRVVDMVALQAEVAAATEEKSRLNSKVQGLHWTIKQLEKYATIRKEREAAQSKLAEFTLPEMSLIDCRTNLERLNKAWGARQSKVAAAIKERDAFIAASNKGVCPTCGSKADVTAQITALTLAIREDSEYVDRCAESITKFTGYCETWASYKSAKTRLECLLAEESGAPKEAWEEVEAQLLDAELLYAEACRRLEAANRELVAGTNHVKLKSDIQDLRAKLSQGTDCPYTIQDQTQKGVQLNLAVAALQSKKREVEGLQIKLRTHADLNAMVRAARELNRQVEENNAKITLQIDQLKKELEACESDLEHLKMWQGILGSKGYRVARIKKFVGSLNKLMVKYAQMVSGGRIKCSFFITDSGEIDFTITDEAKEMAYELWSEGEKARVKLVCLFAVLELLESMGSLSYNVLALDEIFSALDTSGKEGLFNVLTYLKGHNKAIYTIAHEDLALDLAYDFKVRAKKFDDGTTEVGYV